MFVNPLRDFRAFVPCLVADFLTVAGGAGLEAWKGGP